MTHFLGEWKGDKHHGFGRCTWSSVCFDSIATEEDIPSAVAAAAGSMERRSAGLYSSPAWSAAPEATVRALREMECVIEELYEGMHEDGARHGQVRTEPQIQLMIAMLCYACILCVQDTRIHLLLYICAVFVYMRTAMKPAFKF
jgi:hypothetical protein